MAVQSKRVAREPTRFSKEAYYSANFAAHRLDLAADICHEFAVALHSLGISFARDSHLVCFRILPNVLSKGKSFREGFNSNFARGASGSQMVNSMVDVAFEEISPGKTPEQWAADFRDYAKDIDYWQDKISGYSLRVKGHQPLTDAQVLDYLTLDARKSIGSLLALRVAICGQVTRLCDLGPRCW